MFTKSSMFAKWSGPFSWVIAAMWLIIAVLQFTGDSENKMLIGSLWLVGAVAFAVSALVVGRLSGAGNSSDSK